MIHRLSLRCGFTAMVALSTLTTAFAGPSDVIRSASSVIKAPAHIGGFSFDRTIDQSGLSVNYVSGVTNFAAYVASDPVHSSNVSQPNFGASFVNTPVDVDFDLGASYNLNELALWNYPFTNSAAITTFQIFTSSTSNFSSAFPAGSFTALNDGNTNHAQVFDLNPSSGQYVRLHVTGTTSGGRMGFSEVAFGVGTQVAAPEPASLLLLGMAVLPVIGMIRRRRA